MQFIYSILLKYEILHESAFINIYFWDGNNTYNTRTFRTFRIGIWRAGGCKWKKGDEEEVESEREKRKREKVDMDVEKRET